ncbi:MAG: ATP-binding protein [Thermodesulfobacteriota bacterium]
MQNHFSYPPAGNDKAVILLACGASELCGQMQSFLQQDYHIIHTSQCADALRLVVSHAPDLILLSAQRDCDGICVCEQLQKNFFQKRPAALMLFGPDDDELIDLAFAAGVDDYVREPIHWKLLHYRINFLIQKRRAEIELSDFASRLEQINRELKDFTYVVSHDLQEPLHLIRAFAERITRKSHSVLDEQGALYLQRIEKAASRMQGLIDGLLQYSRLTTQAREFIPVDLNSVISEVIADLEARIDIKKARVRIAAGLGTVEADPLQMRQLFQNLVSNALKYSSPGEPPFIEVFPLIPPQNVGRGTLCQVVVKDNGIGFDACFQEQIFGMFQRLHGRDEYNGTGIGLAICKKIVDRHGGTISARSAAGKGAEFIVVLPVRQIKRK